MPREDVTAAAKRFNLLFISVVTARCQDDGLAAGRRAAKGWQAAASRLSGGECARVYLEFPLAARPRSPEDLRFVFGEAEEGLEKTSPALAKQNKTLAVLFS